MAKHSIKISTGNGKNGMIHTERSALKVALNAASKLGMNVKNKNEINELLKRANQI